MTDPVSKCIFCDKSRLESQIVLENKTCLFIDSVEFVPNGVLTGSGMIIPKTHRETPFDLSDDEIRDTFFLLHEVKKYLD
jgi:histidine triad (HIT) family protein